MTAFKKKKMQTSAKLIFQFFACLHFLTQIFAHSCNRWEASKERIWWQAFNVGR